MTACKPKGAAIAAEVAEKRNVTMADMAGPSRVRALVRARCELSYRLRTELKWSLPRIGRMLNRDHTTIRYQVRQHAARTERADNADHSH